MAFESNVALHRIASVVASAAALVTFFQARGTALGDGVSPEWR